MSISSTLVCFLSSVLSAVSFLLSYILVPAASSSMDKISGGFMFSTFVIRPCMMRKCGLLTLSCTEWNRFCTRVGCAVCPLIMYLFRPPMTIWRVTVIWSQCS